MDIHGMYPSGNCSKDSVLMEEKRCYCRLEERMGTFFDKWEGFFSRLLEKNPFEGCAAQCACSGTRDFKPWEPGINAPDH